MIEPEALRRLVAEHCSEQEREAAELVFERNLSVRRADGRGSRAGFDWTP